MEQLRHRPRLSYYPRLPFTHERAPPAWIGLEGQGRPEGVIGLGGGQLHHNDSALAFTIELAEGSSTKSECAHYTKVVRRQL
jgi:hypothetical protein